MGCPCSFNSLPVQLIGLAQQVLARYPQGLSPELLSAVASMCRDGSPGGIDHHAGAKEGR